MAKVNRSAKSGKFVDQETAKKNPDTTVTEKVKSNKAVKAKIQNSLNIINNHLVLIQGLMEKL